MNLASLLLLILFLISGYSIARLVLRDYPIHELVLLGGAIGLLLLMWLPALFSFFLRFTKAAQLSAAALAALIGCLCFFFQKKLPCPIREKPKLLPMLATLLPLFLLGTYLFSTHTIPTAADGSLHVGQSTYGDLSLHLGIVTSLSEQGNFPPEYSIFPGTQVGYPFLCDSISATFYKLGASLRFSMLLPALAAYAVVLLGVWCFFERWLKKPSYTVLATLLFFVGGGFGFAYTFDLMKENPGNLIQAFTGFYRTPTNQPDQGLLWVNPIADMLVPQRATLFGWAILFPCLTLLQGAAFDDELTESNRRKKFLLLGCIAGLLPLIHTHSFLALGIISAAYLFRSLWRKEWKRLPGWAMYAGAALLLAAPQLLLFTFKQAGGFLTINWNWSNTRDSFLWFYLKNLGVIFLMLPVSLIIAKKEDRAKYSGALLVWALSEIIQFQPNPYDNNKLLFIWFAFTCAIVSTGLFNVYHKLQGLPGRRMLAGITLIALFLSGSMTLVREAVSDYELISTDHVEAAKYIKENTEPDALFLTSNNHNNTVAVLTGRNILCGTDSFLYYHGIDTSERQEDVALMFEYPEQYFYALSQKYGIDYVYISFYERYDFYADESYFYENYPLVFKNDEIAIYKVS